MNRREMMKATAAAVVAGPAVLPIARRGLPPTGATIGPIPKESMVFGAAQNGTFRVIVRRHRFTYDGQGVWIDQRGGRWIVEGDTKCLKPEDE